MPTSFVHFTAYEVEHEDGKETIYLSLVYVQSYRQKCTEHDVKLPSPILDGFMDQIPQLACYAGTLLAIVTVFIFVDV
jgi:hypothetical protein